MGYATVDAVNNSLVLRIPDSLAKAIGLSVGDMADISVQGDTLVIKKLGKQLSCQQYLESFYGKSYDILQQEVLEDEEYIDWGNDTGAEVIE